MKDISPEGKKLIQDTREVINTARILVQEKNADELFQQFVWHTRSVDTDGLKSGDLNEAIPVEVSKAKGDADNGVLISEFFFLFFPLSSILAVKHLRSLLNLILTNSEVRKLLSDFSVIGRDLLSRGASKVASAVGPSDEQLRNVDQSAPHDQFITEGGRPADPKETPVLDVGIPGTERNLQMHPKEDQARIVNPNGTQRPIGEVRDQALGQYEQAKDQAVPLANQATNNAASQAQEVAEGDSPLEVDEKKKGMMGRMRQIRVYCFFSFRIYAYIHVFVPVGQRPGSFNPFFPISSDANLVPFFQDNLNERIPQDKKDSAKDNYERGKHFLTEEYFPEERRDQFIFRGKKVCLPLGLRIPPSRF